MQETCQLQSGRAVSHLLLWLRCSSASGVEHCCKQAASVGNEHLVSSGSHHDMLCFHGKHDLSELSMSDSNGIRS